MFGSLRISNKSSDKGATKKVMEKLITAGAALLGWTFGMITKNWIGAILLAAATGAAGYIGQQIMKYTHTIVKEKIKSIHIKFKR